MNQIVELVCIKNACLHYTPPQRVAPGDTVSPVRGQPVEDDLIDLSITCRFSAYAESTLSPRG